MPSKSAKASSVGTYILFAVVIFLVLLVVWLFLTTQGILNVKVQKPGQSGNELSTGPTPTPTPTWLKPGKDTYAISQAPGIAGPKVSTLTLDELDPKKNDKQTITAHVVSDQPVTAVSIEYISDNKTRTLPLTMTGGIATNADWQAVWTVDDTVLYKYILNISATANGITNKVQVAPRQ
jgi:hypothetical protein